MTNEEARAILVASSDETNWLSLPQMKVEARLFLARHALSDAKVPYVVVGGLAVAAWVRTADASADRGTPTVDLLIRSQEAASASDALTAVGFVYRSGLRHAELPETLSRSAIRLWPVHETCFDDGALERCVTLEEARCVALEDLVSAKLALWRIVDIVHLDDMIDASWLPRLPEPLAARLQELLDDPEG